MERIRADDSLFHVETSDLLIRVMHIHDNVSDGIQLAGILKRLEVVVQIILCPARKNIDNLVIVEVIEDTDIITVFEITARRVYLVDAYRFRKGSSWDMTVLIEDPYDR